MVLDLPPSFFLVQYVSDTCRVGITRLPVVRKFFMEAVFRYEVCVAGGSAGRSSMGVRGSEGEAPSYSGVWARSAQFLGRV